MVIDRKIPEWLKVKMPSGENYTKLKKLVIDQNLNTVCQEAKCPNIGDCWERETATFMILGDICTRACTYCAVTSGKPKGLDLGEPIRLAKTIQTLNLKYAVITSVNRDDLADGGSFVFSECIRQIKKLIPTCKVEVLTPDFAGNLHSLKLIIDAGPDVFNHNIESVARIFPKIRAKGNYKVSLGVLANAKNINPSMITKSGLMVGLGETIDEIFQTMQDLRNVKCDLLTVGQYLRPTKAHTPMARWYTPQEFKTIQNMGLGIGFKHVASGPLVRSSFHADEQHKNALNYPN
jgi:lipoic acid synthetase